MTAHLLPFSRRIEHLSFPAEVVVGAKTLGLESRRLRHVGLAIAEEFGGCSVHSMIVQLIGSVANKALDCWHGFVQSANL